MNLEKKIKQAIKQNESDYFKHLDSIIRIKSVFDKPVSNAPFGQGPADALRYMLNLANSMGFNTKNIDNAVGFAELSSEKSADNKQSKKYVASVQHLDVVPAGEGWTLPPFELTEQNGILYGRGILDDKGPALAILFAAKILKDLDIKIKTPFRMIFGTNEENGSHELSHYLAEEPVPKFCFTPDSKFPIIWGEEGIVNLELITHIPENQQKYLHPIKGDMNRNRVPSNLSIKVADKEYCFKGISAHAGWPWCGKNALTLLAKELINDKELQKLDCVREYFQWLFKSFYGFDHGEGMGLLDFDFSEDLDQIMVLTPYGLDVCPDKMILGISVRYPTFITEQQIIDKILNSLSNYKCNCSNLGLIKNTTYKIERSAPPAFMDMKNPYVIALSKVYGNITNRKSKPITSTGGTYAKKFPNTVAFGPLFPDTPNCDGIPHNPNEWMYKKDLLQAIEIYAHSILAMSNL